MSQLCLFALALLAYAVPTSITLYRDPHVRAAGERRLRK